MAMGLRSVIIRSGGFSKPAVVDDGADTMSLAANYVAVCDLHGRDSDEAESAFLELVHECGSGLEIAEDFDVIMAYKAVTAVLDGRRN